MQLTRLIKTISKGKAILSAEFTTAKRENKNSVFFSYPEEFRDYLPDTADPFLPALLIPAMMAGEDLEIIPPVSGKLLGNQQQIQDIFTTWHPGVLHRVKVKAHQVNGNVPRPSGNNATFFSGGVDSMYTMLKYLPENNPPSGEGLSSLIYMKGLELPLSIYSQGQDKRVTEDLKKLAGHYQLQLISGETNIRDVFPIDYAKLYTGPCLASVALSLSNGLDQVYIPSSCSYASMFPDPTNPLTDPLWSNEKTGIFHDGAEKERAEKIAELIAEDPYALASLRVCVSNSGDHYNCCRCWKCIRTMISLEIIGKLQGSKAFPKPLPAHYAKELRTYNVDSMEFTMENWRLAKKYGRKDLERILFNEIRIGRLDLFREGRPITFLLKELAFYLRVKLGRFLGIIDF